MHSATMRTMADRGKSIWRLEEDKRSPVEERVREKKRAGKGLVGNVRVPGNRGTASLFAGSCFAMIRGLGY